MDTLLTVEEAAERLGTSVRFVRRLIVERRIAYTELGRHVRIAASDLDAFITPAGSRPARHTSRGIVDDVDREARPQRNGQLPCALS
jgi:excisionase family DNA binding protein